MRNRSRPKIRVVETRSEPGDGERAPESPPDKEMLELARPECLRLLAQASFGRLAVNGSRGPIIRPVNYAFDEPSQSVVFRTALGSKLHALLMAGRAAFEIDGTDPGNRTGWSVVVVGVTEEVTAPAEVRRLAQTGPQPWGPGAKLHWVRIRTNIVSGRRIVLPGSGASGYRV